MARSADRAEGRAGDGPSSRGEENGFTKGAAPRPEGRSEEGTGTGAGLADSVGVQRLRDAEHGQEPEGQGADRLKTPAERDESPVEQTGSGREKGDADVQHPGDSRVEQAYQDLEAGQMDTDGYTVSTQDDRRFLRDVATDDVRRSSHDSEP